MMRVRFKPRPLAVAALAVLLTLVGIVLASNFIGGEKKIERRIERLHTLDDPRFHHELGVLLGELEMVAKQRSMRRVDVLGEAGVGKSRLVNEFIDAATPRAAVIRAACLPYGEGITFWPVVELIRGLAGIDVREDPADARAKLEATVDDRDVAARLGSLLGLVDEPFPLGELFWAVRRLVEHVGALRPFVFVIDGLHWAEPTLLELLDHLSSNVSDSSVLLVTMARPDDESWAAAVGPRQCWDNRFSGADWLSRLRQTATDHVGLICSRADHGPWPLGCPPPASPSANAN